MAKKQTLIHLHGNTPFNAPTSIEYGELVIEHGSGAENVKMHTRSGDDQLATFITETAINDKITVVNGNITTLSNAVATLNGEANVNGSVKKALADAKAYTDEREEAIDVKWAAADEQVLADAKADAAAQIEALDLANTYDAKGAAEAAQGAAIAKAEELDEAMDARVKVLEEIDHDHENKDVLDGITAEKVAAWDAAEQNAKNHANSLNTTLQGEVDAIDSKIGEGFSDTDTVAKAIAAAKTTVSAASGSAIKVTQTTDGSDAHFNYELSLEGIASSSDLSTLQNQVSTLIDGDNGKSVRTIANEELAAQLLSGEADADFKTLQELAAWLEDHPESVATINANIEALSSDVATLKGEENVDGSVKKALKDAKAYTDEEIAELDLANTYEAKGAAAQALADAKADATAKASAAQSAAIAKAEELDEVMDGRVKALEEIDHEAYKAADTVITNTINSMKITLPSGDISLIDNKFDLSTMIIDCGTY